MKVIVCPNCGNRVDEDLWKCSCGGKKPIAKPEKETKKK